VADDGGLQRSAGWRELGKLALTLALLGVLIALFARPAGVERALPEPPAEQADTAPPADQP
jgi:hypothetical protein